jgi:hypothetical protein
MLHGSPSRFVRIGRGEDLFAKFSSEVALDTNPNSPFTIIRALPGLCPNPEIIVGNFVKLIHNLPNLSR